MSRFEAIREECCDANRQLGRSGLVDLTFGNASVADHEQRVFAIKPSGVAYDGLTPAQMVIVDFDGNVVEGELRYSSDTPTHRRLYLGFAGVRSIVHTHSRHAVAFAQAGREIPCWGTTHADYFYGAVPVTRSMTAKEIGGEYEWETGSVILERFADLNYQQVNAVLVRHHGPFVWTTGTGAKAVEIALALEIVAQMALATAQLSPACPPIAPELLDRHFLRKHGPGAYYGQPGRGDE